MIKARKSCFDLVCSYVFACIAMSVLAPASSCLLHKIQVLGCAYAQQNSECIQTLQFELPFAYCLAKVSLDEKDCMPVV